MQTARTLKLVAPPEATPPPEDVVAERALLGSVMAGDAKLEDVEDLVDEDMFAVRMHGIAWQAVTLQRDAGEPYDFVEIRSMLVEGGHTPDEVADVVEAFRDHVWTPGAKAARSYAEHVRRAWCARRTRIICTDLTAHAEHRREALDEAIVKADEQLRAVAHDMAPSGAATDIQTSLGAWCAALAKPPEQGLPSGIVGLDAITGGYARQQTTVIGARTSVGKSALSLQCAVASAKAGHGVLYVSLEMTPIVLTQRAISHIAQVNGTDLKLRRFDTLSLARISEASRDIRDGLPIKLNACQSMSLAEILALVTDTHRTFRRAGQRLALVVVDHLGLVRPRADAGKTSREQQVAEVSRSLRGIAERFDCHVIACCQVNRGAEQAKGAEKRPQLHQLRDSGSVEQDADNVLLIHRPRDAAGLFLPAPAEIVVAKNRVNGTLGMVSADFNGGTQTFTEVRE